VAVVVLAPVAVFLAAMSKSAVGQGGALREGLEPTAFLWMVLGFVIGPVMGANNLGSELSMETLPLLVSQSGSRVRILVAKAIAQSLYFSVLVTTTTSAALVAAVLAGASVGGRHGVEFGVTLAVSMLLSALVTMVLSGAIALVATLVARSPAAGALVAMTLQLPSRSTFGERIAPYLPWYYLHKVSTVMTMDSSGATWRSEGLLSAVAVIGYAAAIVAVGCVVMTHQDVASSGSSAH
jgi:ABC-type transport system involved in multi-copper enzyme maturation permease subunit